MLSGIAIAAVALVSGVAATGISARYFLQPTGLLIVLGGTIGVMMITTPFSSLILALRRALDLFAAAPAPDREKLIEEIVSYARIIRVEGVLAIEPKIDRVSEPFLKEALVMALDAKDRLELQSALENRIRITERQSEVAAKVFEVAGGFAPTIGVLGTVVGLIDILRQFSSVTSVAGGIGVAFTSTIYGLALANLVLLPAAHRMRAIASETLDLQEMMTEGAVCLFEGMHPRLVRHRLRSFLNIAPLQDQAARVAEPLSATEGI